MARRVGGRRRRDAKDRFRPGFLNEASDQLRQFAQLLRDEPDVAETVSFELRRLAETAGTLHLVSVARAAEDAADEIVQGAPDPRALRRVANAIRNTGPPHHFGPIVIVGAAEAETLRADAALSCEPVQVFADLPAFVAALHTEQPTAIVLPVDATEAVRQLVLRERFPVLVHGRSSDWAARLAAMDAGAHGFLLHPLTWREVTRLARWKTQTLEDAFEVLLLADDDEARDALGRALEQAGIAVVTATDPSELSGALQSGAPRGVVLGSTVAGHSASAMARMVRGHPRCNHIPILVFGRPDDSGQLRAHGVDDVMRPDVSPAAAAARVRERVARFAALPWSTDPVSGLANRLGVLDALDAQLADASRTGSVLSVVRIEIEGLRVAMEAFGAGAPRNARRHLAELMGQQLRRTDIFGELALGELLIAFPNCPRQTALQRSLSLIEAFADRTSGDAQLRDLHFALGVADTRSGLSDVAQRAEGELASGQ